MAGFAGAPGTGGAAGAGGSSTATGGMAGFAGAAGGDAGTVTIYSALADTSKWSQFRVASVANRDSRFGGGTFDGRYVYLAPIAPLWTETGVSMFLRHDTQVTSSFDQGWEALDASTLGLNDTNFFGAVFDGRYVYYVPQTEGRQTGPTIVPSGMYAMCALP